MKISSIVKPVITLSVVAAAAYGGFHLWHHYMDSAWTRDGRIKAEVINVAPDVSGQVDQIDVVDNQAVHKGDVLFRIDSERFRIALAQAEAISAARRADRDQKQKSSARRAQVDDLVVSNEVRDAASSQASVAAAQYQEAEEAVKTAKLNLARTEIHSPVDGYIVNLKVHAGDYAQVGRPALAVVDRNSFWVSGYFEENKIPLLHINDKVKITLMGANDALDGHVESISRAVADRENATNPDLLANVNPAFSWVRLAQRIPVRIHLDNVPDSTLLSAGMSCTIVAHPKAKA